jgi:hypothetical protein
MGADRRGAAGERKSLSVKFHHTRAFILQTLKENAGNVVFRAESIRGQGTWFTLMFDAAPGAMPKPAGRMKRSRRPLADRR